MTLRLSNLKILGGPNVWSAKPMLEVDIETNSEEREVPFDLPQLTARLRQWFKTQPNLSASDALSTELDCRINDVASWAELLGQVTLALQNQAGTLVEQLFVATDDFSNGSRIAIEIVEPSVGRLALEMALQLLESEGKPFPDFVDCRRRLSETAREACYGATTAPIAAYARARGIPVIRLDGDCILQLGYGSLQHRLHGMITERTSYLAESIARDKVLTKQLMQRIGLPTPVGRLVRNAEEAWEAACSIGVPVVVKPRDADYSNGVSVNLTTQEEVFAAWEFARQCRSEVIVERFLIGAPHRLLIVDDQLVAAARRDPAHVIGNGTQTIRELIAIANRDPRRGEGRDCPWYPIAIDERLEQAVARYGYTLESIPSLSEFISLQFNPQSCISEMIQDVTDLVHPEVAAMAREAVRITGLDISGVDIVATDISRPLVEQQGGILEVNAGPAIYMHVLPTCNPPRPVPQAVVNSLIPPGQTGEIPIIMVQGNRRATPIAQRIAVLCSTPATCVGVATAAGVTIGERFVTNAPADNIAGCQSLLLHPDVDIAVAELSAEAVRNSGLPTPRCHTLVLTDKDCDLAAPLSRRDQQRCRQLLIESVDSFGRIVADCGDLTIDENLEVGDDRLVVVGLSADEPLLREHRRRGGLIAYYDSGLAVIADDAATYLRQHLAEPAATIEARRQEMLALAAAWSVRKSNCRPEIDDEFSPSCASVEGERSAPADHSIAQLV